MSDLTGRDAFLSILEDEGVEVVFGNPGTTELPIMDALVDHPNLKYVLGLQESVVVAMAEAYARASGKLAAVNLHVAPGLGNAIGAIYNAQFAGTPLVITAGQQEHGHGLTEPLLYGNLVPMAAPVVKWATEVDQTADIPRVFRRAAKVATSAPTGPVFISLPGDVLLGNAEMDLGSTTRVDSRTRPGDDALDRLAARLLAAGSPVLISSHEVYTSDAMEEVAQVAELLGAPVYSQSVSYLAVYPTDHPLYMGELTRSQPYVRSLLEPHDLLLMVGGDGMRMSVANPVDPMPPGLPVVQIGTRDWEIAKNYPAEIAIDADVKATLAALVPVLRKKRSRAQAAAADQRAEKTRAENWATKRAARVVKTEPLGSRKPIMADYLMLRIAETLPPDAVVVDEGITTTRGLLAFLPIRDRQRFYGLPCGGIGWGVPGAVGVQLALPQRRVVAIIGDGSSMYSIQGLWTAAHLNLPITFIIADNGAYSILKERLIAFGGSSVAKETVIGMDFNPAIRFTGLAESMGLKARRVEDPAEIVPALRWALSEDGPTLLDMVVQDISRS